MNYKKKIANTSPFLKAERKSSKNILIGEAGF